MKRFSAWIGLILAILIVAFVVRQCRNVNADNYQKGLDDLNDPAFLKLYCPEKATRMENFAIAKAWAADVKPIYVAKCKFCRICFETEEELVRHLEISRPCAKCRSVCSSGGEIHRCSTFGGSIVEDRIPAVIKNDEEEL